MAVAMLSKHKQVKLPALGPNLSAGEAREIYRRGEEATVFALLELARHWEVAEQSSMVPTPATPSAMMPTFQKPAAKRGKRPGHKPGHAGAPRVERPHSTVFKEQRAQACPTCGGSLTRCSQTRTRETVDIPAGIHVDTTRHPIHRDWCQTCHLGLELSRGGLTKMWRRLSTILRP